MPGFRRAHRQVKVRLLLVAQVSLLIFGLVYFARVSYAGGDPRYSLLVSQSILENGTLRLDEYRNVAHLPAEDYRLHEVRGHLYYYFPPGTSLFSLPFVWLARQAGMDMAIPAHEDALQNLISAILCVVTFLFLYGAISHIIEWPSSLIVASIFFLGSSLVSTLGVALWSSHFATTLIAIILYLFARSEKDAFSNGPRILVGCLLFAAYFARPTSILLAMPLLILLNLKQRAAFLQLAGTLAVLVCLFVAFNLREYGQLVPDYYASTRLNWSAQSWHALYGHLFSPARGLLVFSPFLLLLLPATLRTFTRLRQRPLFWLVAGWFVGHLIAVSAYENWWGGYSYGPRLMAEIVVGLALLAAMCWNALRPITSPRIRRAYCLGFILLGGVAILINSWQGLYSLDTTRWNRLFDADEMPRHWIVAPDVDQYPEYLFDWRYPQFLANAELLKNRYLQFGLKELHQGSIQLAPYTIGQSIEFISAVPYAFLAGWSVAEQEFRWSKTRRPVMVFLIEKDVPLEGELLLELHASSLGLQRVFVSLNGHAIGQFTYSGIPETQTMSFAGHWLQPGVNQLEFYLPDARAPNWQDPRRLGLALIRLRLHE